MTNDLFRWRALITSYLTPERRALKFESVEEMNRVIELCFSDPELIAMPFDFADGLTMIVPEEAIELLRGKGLKFEDSELLSMSDLTPKERAELQRKYGM